MSTHGQAFQNGTANRSNGMPQGPPAKRPRIFTVDEALPYTPLSSLIPFNPDIIPLPSMGLRSSTSIFSTPAEREGGRQGLESLNHEAQDKSNTSQRLEQSLNHLKELLQPEGISRFKFKTAPKFSSNPEQDEQPRIVLSSFARMVIESTAIEFDHTPIEKPSRSSTVELGRKPKSPSKSRYEASHSYNSNAHSYNQNATAPLQPAHGNRIDQPFTPKKQVSTNGSSTPQVVISALPNSFRRNEYTPSQIPVVQNTASIKTDRPIHPQAKPRVETFQPQVAAMAPIPRVEVPRPSEAPAITSKPRVEILQTQKVPAMTSKPRVEILQHSQHTPPVTKKARAEIPQASQHQPAMRQPAQLQPYTQDSKAQNLAVVIPGPRSTFRPEEYQVLPDSPDTPDHISKKRTEQEAYEDDLVRDVDERERANKAYRSLCDFLQDIFEAEDQMDGSIITDHFFAATSEGICLNIATQTKVDTLLQKTILVARFSQVPLDDLQRLQRLCEGAVKDAGTLDLKVEETMGSSEVDAWMSQMSAAEMGVKAARTSLRLMSGGREEKQIYSEDIIQSALDAFKNVTDNALVPIVEMRSSGSSAALFKLLAAEKLTINNLMKQCHRLLSLMAKLVSEVDLSDTVINSLEFTASQLVFVENATTEKDSVLGISKFDNLRTAAMDVLSEIFLCKPAQRKGILTEILASLARLPATKQSARQYKLAEGGSIQHVSALIMRLIQTSANKSDDIKEQRRKKAVQALNGEDDSELHISESSNEPAMLTSESQAEKQSVTAVQQLDTVISPLLTTAKQHATNVVNYIVERAMTSTKTGDTPYRNLLDLFVQDFITCLSSSEWPAAELLLRLLLIKMVILADGKHTPAPAKNMALEILGSMAAAISELYSDARKLSISEANGQSELGRYLAKLAEERLENRVSAADMLSWQCGPFRTSVEALDARSSNDIQLSSAVGLIKLEWAYRVHTEFDLINEDEDDYKLMEKAFGCLAFRLRMMVTDRRWLSTEYSFDNVPTTAGRLAYTLTLLDSDFAKCLSRVLRILLYSMASDQATVRSKSLKSINHLFETDPTIIDREPTVVSLIQERLNDPSVQVRESALNLIAKIISSRQALENENISLILARTRDSGVGVRKRAMKLAKEIYLRNQDQSVRSAVAEALMHRVDEPDEGVRDLARQTMEEIWMSPFYESTAANDHSPQFKLAIADHVALMVKTVQGLQPNGHQPSNVLDKVLQNMLSENSKFAEANLRVCKVLVAAMFETIIDNSSEDSGASSAIDALRILETFAKSNAKMFTVEQMQLLQPYTKNLRTSEQLAIFRPVVNIYRHVLPHLSRIHDDFLQSVRADLIPLINKVTTTLVDDVVACVSIICKTLEDFSRLNQVLSQVLKRILTYKNTDLKPEEILYLTKLLPIAGYCAKNCDFEPQRQLLATHFPKLKNDSVPKLVTDTLAPFASPVCPISVRKPALEGIGMVCQSWPKNFSFVNVFTSFEQVFDEKLPALERIVMKAFQNFLFIEEKRSEAEKEALPGASADPKAKLGVMGGSHGDGIALGIAQRFLSKIITVALSSKNDGDTLLATEVIASIAHQGLVHPKLPGIALIALETSQNPKIAEIAFREHQKLHEKHETLFERDYMTAVHGAYDYQRDVVQDTRGAISKSQGYTAKLSSMVEVLKISKVKTRKKFYDNLCSQLDVSKPRKDGNDKQMPARNVADHLAFSQFIAENMAFFDYPTIDELLSAITAMEKRVFLVGTEIAHSIETEIFHIRLDAPTQTDENGQLQPPENAINVSRLKELTVSTMTLSLLGEARTYLKRQYGLKTSRQDGKSKAVTKDSNRAPVRLPGVNGDKFWAQVTTIMSALESEETMMNQCRSFVELLTHDPDFKVAAEGDEERPVTPDDDEGERGGTPGPPGSGRNRKRKASITPLTPGGKKKRGRAKGTGKRASMERSDDDDDY